MLFQLMSSVVSVWVFCCSSLGLLYDLHSTSFNPRTICSVSSSPPGNAAHLRWAMYQLVHPTLLQSIAFRLWQIYLPKIVRQCGQLSSSPPGSAAHLWWAMMIGWVIWVMKVNQNVKKSPPKSSKNEKLIFILRSTSDDWPSDPSNKRWPKCKKVPLSHQKMKCSFLDYVQILMISWAMKVNQNVTKGPLSHRKMKYSFLYYIQLLMIGWAIRCPTPQQKKFDFFKSTFLTWPKYAPP